MLGGPIGNPVVVVGDDAGDAVIYGVIYIEYFQVPPDYCSVRYLS